MDKFKAIEDLRLKLSSGLHSVGSWLQLDDSSVAEIIGSSGYDWVAVDLEHGSISTDSLPDLFRSLELNSCLPFSRVASVTEKDCKLSLDAGAAGLILPMIKNADELSQAIEYCCWPPEGKRGVGFSRANLFGRNFEDYKSLAGNPFIVSMIENISAAEEIDAILDISGLDAIFIGAYDLSASMGITAEFDNQDFKDIKNMIITKCKEKNIPCGIHQVQPDPAELIKRVEEGFTFLAYSIDTCFLTENCRNPLQT